MVMAGAVLFALGGKLSLTEAWAGVLDRSRSIAESCGALLP